MANGETVLMDKVCPQNSTTAVYKKPSKKRKEHNPRQRRWHQQSSSPSTNQSQIQKSSSVNNRRTVANSIHNPSYTLPLNRILSSVKAPDNWFVQSFSVQKGDVITASPKRLNSPSALKTGASIHRYTNTHKYFKKDAFSVAIDMFHDIRFDNSIEMIESEFISHNKFKVFNVHYKKSRLRQATIKAVIQFYVDEKNNDLYVVKFRAPQKHWPRLVTTQKHLFRSLVF